MLMGMRHMILDLDYMVHYLMMVLNMVLNHTHHLVVARCSMMTKVARMMMVADCTHLVHMMVVLGYHSYCIRQLMVRLSLQARRLVVLHMRQVHHYTQVDSRRRMGPVHHWMGNRQDRRLVEDGYRN